MTKTEEFENKMIADGISDGDLITYEKLLKRSGDDFLRLQHCYTAAVLFPSDRADEAVGLIECGPEKISECG